ncbi:MAG: thiol oxidoreductase [Chloroflexi bacterium]|nr:thiol oxidoreductase [Chloroflexota bacterium]
MPNINPRSTARRGSEQTPHHQFAKIAVAFLILFALTWGVACASHALEDDTDYSVKVCDRVDDISDGMLREELSVEDIEAHIELLESELDSVRGELVDATERFILALKEILAGGYYDYPTLQVLNYLDTYEHMEQHVEGYEALENVRFECEYVGKEWIGDAPAVQVHFSQSGIEAGKYTLEELIEHGETLFTASFNALDGAGRPTRTGDSRFRDRREGFESFNRISGPDSNACSGCHNLPVIGGGGDNVANVFVLGQRFEFVDFNDQMEFDFRDDLEDRLQYEQEDEDPLTLQNVGNERNTVGMFGSGFVELLAREITRELLAQEEATIAEAKKSGWPVRREISAKGIDFGAITAHPNGFVYTSEVEGVDGDLIVRPFSQKGVFRSLREFNNDAMLHHHGIENYERVGSFIDRDGDGVVNEMTPGDATALVAFLVSLPAPVPETPEDPDQRAIVELGRQKFTDIGCALCHIPELPLESLVFTEPNEFNIGKDLRPEATDAVLEIDLSDLASELRKDENGHYLIPVFSDLRRHDMGEDGVLDNEEIIQGGVPTEQWMTRRLWGFASEPPFLHHGRATLISDAIVAHGGSANGARNRFIGLPQEEKDALIAFLKTLTIPTQ